MFGDLCGFPEPRNGAKFRPIAVGGDLSPGRLLAAYSHGIFPWFAEEEPIYWWCPDPRFVLETNRFKLSSSLKREARKSCWRVTFDQAFAEVIRACAAVPRPGQDGTWLTPEMVAAYCELHRMGLAHSVECWHEGELAGGLYGVSLGRLFFGESMFHYRSNASKVAFVRLIERLREWDFPLVDCQQPTRYLASFGAEMWSRDRFLDTLEQLVGEPTQVGNWDQQQRLVRP